MTTIAKAVIGAGYGDEGKGTTTDALAARDPGVVVRSNGGAQAGHTVTTPDGRRHVFHHIGAGALAGAATQLSRFFVVHPMFFVEERKVVEGLGGCVDIGVDPRAIVTTPYDVLINQAVEAHRGNARHGSCGFGFGESIERSLRADLLVRAGDLVRNDLVERLDRIRRFWVPKRLDAFGVPMTDEIRGVLDDDAVLRHYLVDCEETLDAIHLVRDARALQGRPVQFEGAQGLLLDQDRGAFPHVTRSNTGLLNMLAIAAEAGIEQIDAHYATRAYVTRHGAGPLAHEEDGLDAFEIVDPTNEPNAWQGAIRHAELDLDVLATAIQQDIGLAAGTGIAVDAGVVVTCIDQAKGLVPARLGGERILLDADGLLDAVARRTGMPIRGVGHGPFRQHQDVVVPLPVAA